MLQVIVLYLIVILHVAGNLFGFYRSIFLYDKPVHFLGGFWVAMMANYLTDKYVQKNLFQHHRWTRLLFLVGVVMIFGFGWEMYEYLADTFIFHKILVMQVSITDTMTDLLTDFLGALIYALFV